MMTPAEYLKKPYGRVVVPESDGSFRAEITEFPGCIALGDTESEALKRLRDVAESWLEATIARGQRIPEPVETTGYSGKLVVRLPKSLHRKAAQQAARDGVSLNQFITSSVAQQVGAQSTTSAQSEPILVFVPAMLASAQVPYRQMIANIPSNALTFGGPVSWNNAFISSAETLNAGS